MTTASRAEMYLFTMITDRAIDKGLSQGTRLDLIMGLEVAHLTVGLRLRELLEANDSDFAYDIVGIQNNMDRTGTGRLINMFVPRFKDKSSSQWEESVHILMNMWDAQVNETIITRDDMAESLRAQISKEPDIKCDMSADEKEIGDPNNNFTDEQWPQVVDYAARKWLASNEMH